MSNGDKYSLGTTVIGLDLGTTAIKGVVVADGAVLRTAERTLTYAEPERGRVELDAEAYWQTVAGLLRELADGAPVAALAICGASGNTLLADQDGKPLTPIINWMDRRCVGNPPRRLATLDAEAVRDVAGWPCVDTFPLAHIGWFAEYRPDTLEKAAHVCMNTDWLLFKLTGKWVMDHSTATTMHLLDQRAMRWHQPYLELLGIEARQLSALCPSGAYMGGITAAAAEATGLPSTLIVGAGSFDHPAAALASGVTEEGELLLSCGTSWVGFTPHRRREAIVGAKMLCDPFLSAQGGPWGGMFSVTAIGPKIDWYVSNLIAPGEEEPLRVFDELAAQSPRGANGLRIDLAAPPRTLSASRADISRAVMEGAAAALDSLLRPMREKGFRFERAVMVGGPSRSPIWPSILAETTGLGLSVGSAHAGAKGAAILGMRALDIFLRQNSNT